MRVEFLRHSGYFVAKVSGDLDLKSADGFKEKIDGELKSLGAHSFVLNLRDLDFIDSTGLAALLGRHKMLAYGGGKMILSEVPPKVLSMLEMAGLLSVIPRARDDDTAVRHLSGGGELA